MFHVKCKINKNEQKGCWLDEGEKGDAQLECSAKMA